MDTTVEFTAKLVPFVDPTEARNTVVSEHGIGRFAPRRHAGLLCLAPALYEPHLDGQAKTASSRSFGIEQTPA